MLAFQADGVCYALVTTPLTAFDLEARLYHTQRYKILKRKAFRPHVPDAARQNCNLFSSVLRFDYITCGIPSLVRGQRTECFILYFY